MTILKNKYFLRGEVYYPDDKMSYKVLAIEDTASGIQYKLGVHADRRWAFEDDLYESKEAYEKEQNEIRVGDEFYYLTNKLDRFNAFSIRKSKCLSLNQFTIFCDDYSTQRCFCFKTKEALLAAVKKAVEECE